MQTWPLKMNTCNQDISKPAIGSYSRVMIKLPGEIFKKLFYFFVLNWALKTWNQDISKPATVRTADRG